MALFREKTKIMFFHDEVKWILVMAQVFGLLPVRGVTAPSSQQLTFSWFSKRVIFTFFVIFAAASMSALTFYRMCHDGFTLHSFGSFVFNANSLIGSVVFLKLAKNWPDLIKRWTKVELSLENYHQRKSLSKKFYLIVSLILSAAIVEHLLSVMHAYKEISATANPTETYFRRSYPHVFDYCPYSLVLGVSMVLINLSGVFSWNFLDAFLMVVSVSLAFRLEQINEKVSSACRKKVESKYYWMKLREDYNNVSVLCKYANEKLSLLILVSFATNMYYIVSQLYWSVQHTASPLEGVYFSFSFGLLLSRTVAVTMFGSKIADESRKPIGYLLALSSEAFNPEVERFITHAYCEPAALTGSGFFVVTRGLLFSMAGSIVTYELFLIQSSGSFNY